MDMVIGRTFHATEPPRSGFHRAGTREKHATSRLGTGGYIGEAPEGVLPTA